MKLSQAIITKCNTALAKLRFEVTNLDYILGTELAKQSRTKSDMAVRIYLEGKVQGVIGLLQNIEGQLEYIQSKALDIKDSGDKDVKTEGGGEDGNS